MADPAPSNDWEYKHLEMREGQLFEDGQLREDGQPVPGGRPLRDRSCELINGGWEPISASDVARRYRRPRLVESA